MNKWYKTSSTTAFALFALPFLCAAKGEGCVAVSIGTQDTEGEGGSTTNPSKEGETCDGIAALTCDQDLVCIHSTGECFTTDSSGTCQSIPEACTEEFSGACGCDGKVYGNVCNASAAGQSVSYYDLSLSGQSTCDPADPPVDCAKNPEHEECKVCTSSDQEGCQPPTGVCGGIEETQCSATADSCMYDSGACIYQSEATGTCTDVSTIVCVQQYDVPSCGCDGIVYASSCAALTNGISIAYDFLNEDDAPPTGEKCSLETKVGQTCGGDTPTPNECGGGEFCSYDESDICGNTDAQGICEVRPDVCPENYDPVCGCDGVTYNNECEANKVGVSVDASGDSCYQPVICEGDYTITTQSDLDKISSCTEITGNLNIQKSDLKNLYGLESIESVGSLIVEGNDSLENLDNLKSLNTINGVIYIHNNQNLSNIDGLTGITSILYGDVIIDSNPNLSNLSGLVNLTEIDWNLQVSNNNSLTELGLQSLLVVGTGFRIIDNISLPTCLASDLLNQLKEKPSSSEAIVISGNASYCP